MKTPVDESRTADPNVGGTTAASEIMAKEIKPLLERSKPG